MQILQVAPLAERVPPVAYGGTERVVAHLTDALVDLGHDVTLFASGDARTKAELVVVRDQAIRLDPAPLKSDLAAHMAMLSEVRRQAHRFDVIHFHTGFLHASRETPRRGDGDDTARRLDARLVPLMDEFRDLPGVDLDAQRKPLE